jgi:hypothetical protein
MGGADLWAIISSYLIDDKPAYVLPFVFRARPQERFFELLDRSGHFTFRDVPPGTYYIIPGEPFGRRRANAHERDWYFPAAGVTGTFFGTAHSIWHSGWLVAWYPNGDIEGGLFEVRPGERLDVGTIQVTLP